MVKNPIIFHYIKKELISDDSNLARELYNRSRYGIVENGKVILSLLEGLYLIEKEKISVLNSRKSAIDFDEFFKKSRKEDSNITVKYPVYKALRERGYIVKTALKFGADFRVYDRGIKPGDDHAKWVVFAVHESEKQTWFDFCAKSRVAHSTRKKLLLGIVDAELDVTFYEAAWIKP
jgi:tRNA-intron endonuclease